MKNSLLIAFAIVMVGCASTPDDRPEVQTATAEEMNSPIRGKSTGITSRAAAEDPQPIQAQPVRPQSPDERPEVTTITAEETNSPIRGKATGIISRAEPDDPQPVQTQPAQRPSPNDNPDAVMTTAEETNTTIRGKSTAIQSRAEPEEPEPFALGPVETAPATGEGFDISGWWDVFQPLEDGGYAFYTKYKVDQAGTVLQVHGGTQIPGEVTWKSGRRFTGELIRTANSIQGTLNADATEYRYNLLEEYGGELFRGTISRASSRPIQIIWVKSDDTRIVHPSEVIDSESALK